MARINSRRLEKSSSSKGRDKGRSYYSGQRGGSSPEKRRGRSPEITEKDIKKYMAKKAEKKAKSAAKKFKDQAVSGYSNDSNPFGDSNLNEKFVWIKKIERDIYQGVPLDEFTLKAEKRRQKERMSEIEKVKKRREQRALEKAQHEEEMALLARERARAEADDFEKKEDEFHYSQSKFRSSIRLSEGRTKPIDVLITYLEDSCEFVQLNEPYAVFKGLTVSEMESLREDIKLHLDMDRQEPTHVEYWEALVVVCDWELAELRKKNATDRARMREEQPDANFMHEQGIHPSVEAEVKMFLEAQSYKELVNLEPHIESEMCAGTAKVVEFWEDVLKRIDMCKAKAFLKEIHAKMLRKNLQRLEQSMEENTGTLKREKSKLKEEDSLQEIEELEEATSLDNEDASDEIEEDAGSFSPHLLHGVDAEEAIDPEEDKAILLQKRLAVLEKQRHAREAMDTNSRADSLVVDFEKRAIQEMGTVEEGDVIFGSGAQVNLDSQVYWWHDKYRPRKPKYFNRVHTGYEWNKYNQTHYDHDNPPPKIVQGYKFNIFYPDLVNKATTPRFIVDKDGDCAETCIIRFQAGPPYEDIAFRIVNKEWEYSHKKGFKSVFERGILQLYFNFKRHRYRR